MRVFVIFEKNHDCGNLIVSTPQLQMKLGVKWCEFANHTKPLRWQTSNAAPF